MIFKSNLSPAQRRLMIRLDDGFDHPDSVGREVGTLHGDEMHIADGLVEMGLVECVPGYGLQFWYRMTEAGRAVQQKGQV